MLRRVVPSFTVEVRRRPRTATKSVQDVQSSETTRFTAFERESHRVAAAAFEAKTPNQPPTDAAASYPKRRILQSLVPEQPSWGQLDDALPSVPTSDRRSRAQKPPSVRAQKTRDQASKAAQTLASSELKAQSTDPSSDGSVRSFVVSPSEGTIVLPGMPNEKAKRIAGTSGDSAPRAKAKRRPQQPRALDDGSAPVSANEQRSVTRVDSLGTVANAAEDVLHQYRKRTIMGRYVFGDELKPGERWKRRLSKGR